MLKIIVTTTNAAKKITDIHLNIHIYRLEKYLQ